jgi:RNA polymerase sigma-70 factor (sigma-E family)
MGIDIRGSAEHSAQRPAAGGAAAAIQNQTSAEAGVTALFEAHSLGLIRLAHIMLGDRSSAEDVVQEAFCGLYRRWPQLTDQAKALPYVRSSVLNGCRTVLRRGQARGIRWAGQPPAASAASAEAAVMSGEERHEVMRALRRLPHRQREVLVLRFYLDLSDAEIARDMGINPGTVRSTASRALTALGRSLGGTA